MAALWKSNLMFKWKKILTEKISQQILLRENLCERIEGHRIKFPVKYTALDCVGCSWENMFQVLPNLNFGEEKNSFRVLTTNNIVKITVRIQFECGLLKVWKDCGMASDESAPLVIYSLNVFWLQSKLRMRKSRGEMGGCGLRLFPSLILAQSSTDRILFSQYGISIAPRV